MNTSELDALIASDGPNMSGEQILELQQRVSSQRYWMAEHVAQAKRNWLQKEADRKAVVIGAKLKAKAEHNAKENKALSETAATDIAEARPEVIRARSEEIMAEADFEHLKLKFQAAGEVLTSLTMRFSDKRDERREARTMQHT